MLLLKLWLVLDISYISLHHTCLHGLLSIALLKGDKCPPSSDALMQAQEVLLDTAWSQDALAFEQWKAILGKDATVAFRGPRVKMSVVQDIPTSIGPHPDTGCAMYHGPMAGR